MLLTLSTILLAVFSLFALVDGVFLHLAWLRLHAREGSWVEHLWHTASAVLMAPILVTVFLAPTAGLTLWGGVGLIALLYVVEIFDVRAERTSRQDLGGLSRGELAMHLGAVVSRSLATLLAFASRPAVAWSPLSPSALGEHPRWIANGVGAMVVGSVAVATLHVWLAWRYRPATRALAMQS